MDQKRIKPFIPNKQKSIIKINRTRNCILAITIGLGRQKSVNFIKNLDKYLQIYIIAKKEELGL